MRKGTEERGNQGGKIYTEMKWMVTTVMGLIMHHAVVSLALVQSKTESLRVDTVRGKLVVSLQVHLWIYLAAG